MIFPTANMVGGAKLGGSPMAQKGTNRYTQLAKTTSSHTKKPQKPSSTKILVRGIITLYLSSDGDIIQNKTFEGKILREF